MINEMKNELNSLKIFNSKLTEEAKAMKTALADRELKKDKNSINQFHTNFSSS